MLYSVLERLRPACSVLVFLVLQASTLCWADDNALAAVSGVVTLEGRPLEGASIVFQPSDERPISTAQTDAKGRFTLQHSTEKKPGAELGEHRVRISTAIEKTDEATGKVSRQEERLPIRYNAESTLTVEVRAGENKLNFELSAQGEMPPPEARDEVEEAVADMADLQQLEWVAPGGVNDPQVSFLANYAKVQSALARRACRLSPEQEKEIEKIDKKWLAAEITSATSSPVKGVVAGIARFLGGGMAAPQEQAREPHEISKIVKARIDDRLLKVLDPEQGIVYEREKSLRADFRSKAMAGVLVAALDKQLFFNEEQRIGLTDSLAGWLKNKDLYWTFYFQNQSYMPDLPSSILSKYLDKEQMVALSGVQKWNYEMDQIEMQMVEQEVKMVIED